MFESEEFRLLDPQLQWHAVAPKATEPVRGWITGPLVVQTVHFSGQADKPCRSKITKGAMKCRCDEEPISARQKGYIPVRTKDGRKLVIIMCATTAKVVREIAHGSPVEFWRPKTPKSPLAVKYLLAEELGEMASKNMRTKQPDDIRPYLIHVLWQDAAVARYFPLCGSASVQPPSEPPAPKIKYPPLLRRKAARDNTVSLDNITEGIGKPAEAV